MHIKRSEEFCGAGCFVDFHDGGRGRLIDRLHFDFFIYIILLGGF